MVERIYRRFQRWEYLGEISNLRIFPALHLRLFHISLLATIFLLSLPLNSQTYFTEDFENGLGKWFVSGLDWDTTSATSRTGKYCVTDSRIGNYPQYANISIVLKNPLNLTTSSYPILEFWHKYSIDFYANCYVEISTDNGFNWSVLKSISSTTQNTWSYVQIDLKSYKSNNIKIRFRLTSSPSTNDGWYIDDLSIKELPQTPVLSLPFIDGFENGLDKWFRSGLDWDTTSSTSRSGKYSLTDSRTGNYSTYANISIINNGLINLSGSISPILTFWHKYSIDFYANCYVEISTDNGFNWSVLKSISSTTQNTWSYVQIDLKSYKSNNIKIRFRLTSSPSTNDGWYIDDLEIYDTEKIQVTSPNGGEVWKAGETKNISWLSNNINNVKIDYSTDGGTKWMTVVSSIVASTGNYSWTVPNTASLDCRVKILDASDSSVFDVSNDVFEIGYPDGTIFPYGFSLKGSINTTSETDNYSFIGSANDVISVLMTRLSGNLNPKIRIFFPGGTFTDIGSSTASAVKGDTIKIPKGGTCIVGVSDYTASKTGKYGITLHLISSPGSGKPILFGTTFNDTLFFSGQMKSFNFSANKNQVVTLLMNRTSGTLNPRIELFSPTGAYLVRGGFSTSATARIDTLKLPSDGIYSILALDWAGTNTGTFDFNLQSVEYIQITSPKADDYWIVGSTQNITWISANIQNVNIDYSIDNGSNWLPIAASISSALGSYAWLIPTTPSNQCKVRISNTANSDLFDISDGVFTISTTPRPSLTVSTPNGGERWIANTLQQIIWASTNVAKIKIEYSTNAGTSWKEIVGSIYASTGTYDWLVPNTPSSTCKVRISDTSNTNLSDVSDNVFSIQPPLPTSPSLLEPLNGSVNIPLNTTLKWNKSADADTYYLQVAKENSFTSTILSDSTLTDTTKYLTNLNEYTTYYWRVKAKNITGTSNFSPIWNFSTINNAPLAPQNLTASAGSTTVTLRWRKNTEFDIRQYYIYQSTSPNPTLRSDSTLGGVSDTTKVISGLMNDQIYFFRTTAVDLGGIESAFSNEVNATPSLSIVLPETPTLVSPNDNTSNLYLPVVLSWSTSQRATSYRLLIALDSSFTKIIFDDTTITSTYKEVSTLSYNTIYYWKTNARNNYGISQWSNIFKFTTATAITLSPSSPIVFPSQSLKTTDYKIISLPGTSTNITVGSILSGVSQKDWRVFRDNGNATDYLEELTSSSKFNPGEGYWLIKKGNLTFTLLNVPMPQVDTNGNTSIALRVGTWNLIGNPFTEPVLWADVLHVNALYNLQLIHYNGGYTESTSLVPFYGYYFDNRTANISTLKIPYNFQIDNQSNKKVTTIDWQLQLILITKTNSDSLNLIGIAKDAQLSRDQYDTRKPPLFQDLSFLYFDRPEWDPAMSKFNSDYRPALEEGQVWDFTISNPSKSEGKIYFLGIENVPLEYEIILLNSENSNLYDLRKDNQYFFANKTSKTNMQLIIGKASFIQKEAKKTIPTDFCLLQNYPNPFNQSTKITYTLPRNSKVIIEIFSLIGQHIIKLVDEFQTAGRHTVEWKGTNEKNEILTSGIYLCRMKVEEFQAFTRRLILLR